MILASTLANCISPNGYFLPLFIVHFKDKFKGNHLIKDLGIFHEGLAATRLSYHLSSYGQDFSSCCCLFYFLCFFPW